jgi:hypothetical protein
MVKKLRSIIHHLSTKIILEREEEKDAAYI